MRCLLIDGDLLVYKACIAAAIDADFGEDMLIRLCDKETMEGWLLDEIDRMLAELSAGDYRVALSGPSEHNWRKKVMPSYKGNRAHDRPVGFHASRKCLEEEYGAVWEQTLEADDLLGIWATEPSDDERIIVSDDKDMATIPGLWCKWPHDKEVREVTPMKAYRAHMLQTLTGDPVDGYQGCPGIGPVGAEKALSFGALTYWENVVGAFRKEASRHGDPTGKVFEDALANARVAYILRHGDYDFETKEVKLWEPPEQD